MRLVIRLLFALFATLLVPSIGHADTCELTGQTCIDSSPCRSFPAGQVCLADVGRSCWTYNKSYQCIHTYNPAIDGCYAIENTAGCWQSGQNTCVAVDFDGNCMQTQRIYTCSAANQVNPDPGQITQLPPVYTVTQSLDTSQCTQYDQSQLCSPVSSTCTEGPETRIINGDPVYEDCWQYTNSYSCIDPAKQDDCTDYENNPTCKETGTSCLKSTDPIGCVMTQVTYSCQTNPGQTTTTEDCSASTTCDNNGNCWNTGSPSDPDFGKAVAGLETGREAGVYGGDPLDLFKGEAESCRKGYGGIQNCCTTSTGGSTNNGIMQQAAASIGSQAVMQGSKYMFDYMYENVQWVQSGMNALGADGISILGNMGNFDFSLYGVGFASASTGAAAGTVGGGLFDSDIALGDGFYFNPYMLAAAIAIQVITKLMSCTQGEQQLGMHRGDNLCYFVGSYCSKSFFGVCMQTVQSYCCYNSILAELIASQGKPQLGMSFGTPENPDCDGFTPDEFTKLDFSKIDLSSFMGTIQDATSSIDTNKISQTITTEMQNITTNPAKVISPNNNGATNPLQP